MEPHTSPNSFAYAYKHVSEEQSQIPVVEGPNGTALVCMDVPSLGAGGAVVAALAGDIVGVWAYRLDSIIGFVLG